MIPRGPASENFVAIELLMELRKHLLRNRKLRQLNRKLNPVRDDESSLIFVHIGKCGGKSLHDAIERSPVIRDRFLRVERIHIAKPPAFQKARYLFVVRNPISRAISAFNWRYKLVVETGAQKDRFEGEYETLETYGTLNALGEALYQRDGAASSRAARDFRRIHHLKEDIAFYLSDLLPTLSAGQVFATMTTEMLDDDIARVLKIGDTKRIHANNHATPGARTLLSPVAAQNLRRFLADDYRCLEELLALSRIEDGRKDLLLQ